MTAVALDRLETRGKILRAALERFGAQGYHATSVQEIADAVGITKTAVLYHFSEKSAILASIAEPMLDQLDAVLDRAEMLDPAKARGAVLEGILEVWLAHRRLLQMNLADLAWGTTASFRRFRNAMLRATGLVAGVDASLDERIRAT